MLFIIFQLSCLSLPAYAAPECQKHTFKLSAIIATFKDTPPQLKDLSSYMKHITEKEHHPERIVHTQQQILRLSSYQFDKQHRPRELIVNAIDAYARANDPKKDNIVSITSAKETLTIKDTGPGMTLANIFNDLLVPNRSQNIGLLDPENATKGVTGKFGQGFFSILSYLQEQDDSITLETQNKESKIKLHFYKKDNEIHIGIEEIENRDSTGTTITIHSSDLEESEVQETIRDTFKFNNNAKILLNDKNIHAKDDITTLTIGEHNHTGFIRIIDKDKPSQGSGTLYLLVNGVQIQKMHHQGINIYKNMVIDLPATVALTPDRGTFNSKDPEINAFLENALHSIANRKDGTTIMNTLYPFIKNTKIQIAPDKYQLSQKVAPAIPLFKDSEYINGEKIQLLHPELFYSSSRLSTVRSLTDDYIEIFKAPLITTIKIFEEKERRPILLVPDSTDVNSALFRRILNNIQTERALLDPKDREPWVTPHLHSYSKKTAATVATAVPKKDTFFTPLNKISFYLEWAKCGSIIFNDQFPMAQKIYKKAKEIAPESQDLEASIEYIILRIRKKEKSFSCVPLPHLSVTKTITGTPHHTSPTIGNPIVLAQDVASASLNALHTLEYPEEELQLLHFMCNMKKFFSVNTRIYDSMLEEFIDIEEKSLLNKRMHQLQELISFIGTPSAITSRSHLQQHYYSSLINIQRNKLSLDYSPDSIKNFFDCIDSSTSPITHQAWKNIKMLELDCSITKTPPFIKAEIISTKKEFDAESAEKLKKIIKFFVNSRFRGIDTYAQKYFYFIFEKIIKKTLSDTDVALIEKLGSEFYKTIRIECHSAPECYNKYISQNVFSPETIPYVAQLFFGKIKPLPGNEFIKQDGTFTRIVDNPRVQEILGNDKKLIASQFVISINQNNDQKWLEECIKNALEANASKIDFRVFLRERKMSVEIEDNGDGLPASEMHTFYIPTLSTKEKKEGNINFGHGFFQLFQYFDNVVVDSTHNNKTHRIHLRLTNNPSNPIDFYEEEIVPAFPHSGIKISAQRSQDFDPYDVAFMYGKFFASTGGLSSIEANFNNEKIDTNLLSPFKEELLIHKDKDCSTYLSTSPGVYFHSIKHSDQLPTELFSAAVKKTLTDCNQTLAINITDPSITQNAGRTNLPITKYYGKIQEGAIAAIMRDFIIKIKDNTLGKYDFFYEMKSLQTEKKEPLNIRNIKTIEEKDFTYALINTPLYKSTHSLIDIKELIKNILTEKGMIDTYGRYTLKKVDEDTWKTIKHTLQSKTNLKEEILQIVQRFESEINRHIESMLQQKNTDIAPLTGSKHYLSDIEIDNEQKATHLHKLRNWMTSAAVHFYNKTINMNFYKAADSSQAHAYKGGNIIGINLLNGPLEIFETLEKACHSKDLQAQEKINIALHVLLTHELVHLDEHPDQATHDKEFFDKQADKLMHIVYNAKLFQSTLCTQFLPSPQP